jgi:hypothetical protein
VYIAVLKDVVGVVEMPVTGKTVPVNDQQHDEKGENGEDGVTPSGMLPIPGGYKSVVTDDHERPLACLLQTCPYSGQNVAGLAE